jgi:hypothetical protein
MQTQTPDFSKMTPQQIQAYVDGLKSSAGAPSGDPDLPDIDGATEVGAPKFPEGTYDLAIESITSRWSQDPTRSRVPLFEADFKVVAVVECLPQRPIGPQDEHPPQAPVSVGEVRQWSANMQPDAQGRPSRQAVRIRHLVQALLRFEPDSELAQAATIGGTEVSWTAIVKEATNNPKNPFAGKIVRAQFTRILTQKGKGFAMYVPAFSVSPLVEKRTSSVIDSY